MSEDRNQEWHLVELDKWKLDDGDLPDHPHIGKIKNVEKELNNLLKGDRITGCLICAYALRTKALSQEASSDNWMWRRLWLRHCLSSDTEFIFTVIEARDDTFVKQNKYEPKPLKISREHDVENIVNESIIKGKNTIGSVSGRDYYLRRIAEWHMRRYNHDAAEYLLNNLTEKRFLDKFSKRYPRLIGATCIGFFPIICIPEFWRYPIVLTAFDNGMWFLMALVAFFMLLSYFYFKVEYVKTTGNRDWERPFRIFIFSVGYSMGIALFLTILFSGHFVGDGFKGCTDLILGLPQPSFFKFYPEITIFFASIAQFIGIVIQFFWEEKNVTEPL